MICKLMKLLEAGILLLFVLCRDNVQAKMLLLREKAERNFTKHSSAMEKLSLLVDHERTEWKFVSIKNKELQDDGKANAEWKTKEAFEAQRKMCKSLLEVYGAVFKHIQEITGESGTNNFVKWFLYIEEDDFAAIDFLIEQDNQKVVLREEITQVSGWIRHSS